MAEQAVTYEQVLKKINGGEYAPVYLLMGEESYYIDKLTDALVERVVKEEHKDFDQTVVYGKDVDAMTIVSLARRYPMMSAHQLVVVKEAQAVKKLEELDIYLKSPQQSTVLVLCYKHGAVDKRKSFYTTIKKKGVVYESKKLYDNQVAGKVTEMAKEKGMSIDVKSANLIAEFLGADLTKIANEIEKLRIVLPKGTAITPEEVQKHIGINKDYNNFELLDALVVKDVVRVARIVDYFGRDRGANPLVMTVAVLFNFFSNLVIYHMLDNKDNMNVATVLKINPYFVGQYKRAASSYPFSKACRVITYLREADVAVKGMGKMQMQENELLKLMVFKILH